MLLSTSHYTVFFWKASSLGRNRRIHQRLVVFHAGFFSRSWSEGPPPPPTRRRTTQLEFQTKLPIPLVVDQRFHRKFSLMVIKLLTKSSGIPLKRWRDLFLLWNSTDIDPHNGVRFGYLRLPGWLLYSRKEHWRYLDTFKRNQFVQVSELVDLYYNSSFPGGHSEFRKALRLGYATWKSFKFSSQWLKPNPEERKP